MSSTAARKLSKRICAHRDIEAVSFVGSTKVAKLVYQQSTHHLKRCIALGGAKNHLFVLPDANPQMTATNVTASMSGCAGQRCMAASAMLAVGNVDSIIDQICDRSAKNNSGQKSRRGDFKSGERENRKLYFRSRINRARKFWLTDAAQKSKARKTARYVGATVIDFVTPEMSVATEEIFGPVISIMRTETLDEAIKNRKRKSIRQRGFRLYAIGRRGALCDGTRFRRNDRREHRRSRSARAVFIRRLERIAFWRERYYGQKFD